MLQPTSPLRTSVHIDGACEFFLKNKNKANKLVSVTNLNKDFCPTKIMEDKNSTIQPLKGYENYHDKNKSFYLRNGPAIFIYKKKKLNSNIYAGKSLKYVMSQRSSVDINIYSDIKKIFHYKS